MHPAALQWTDLGLSPIAFHAGPFPIRWYALSYIAMILLGWWYLRLLIRQPESPMTPGQVEDLVPSITLGVIG